MPGPFKLAKRCLGWSAALGSWGWIGGCLLAAIGSRARTRWGRRIGQTGLSANDRRFKKNHRLVRFRLP